MSSPGRGRRGLERYKTKRLEIVTFGEFQDLVQKIPLTEVVFSSLVTVLFYVGFRIAEVCGDRARKWKKLTSHGKKLSRDGMLPRKWKNTLEGDLWYWEHRGELQGILKEDITLQDHILRIFSKPLKRGKREGTGQLELDVRYPYVDLIVEQWERAKPGERVWPISTRKAWGFISDLSGGKLYPHSFRLSRATQMARNPNMAIADLKQWFGWARGETADKYILPTRSVIKARLALAEEIPPELIKHVQN